DAHSRFAERNRHETDLAQARTLAMQRGKHQTADADLLGIKRARAAREEQRCKEDQPASRTHALTIRQRPLSVAAAARHPSPLRKADVALIFHEDSWRSP